MAARLGLLLVSKVEEVKPPQPSPDFDEH